MDRRSAPAGCAGGVDFGPVRTGRTEVSRLVGQFLAVLLVGGAVAGCSEQRTVRVVGRVTYNGQPVERATVAFYSNYPDDSPASGKTDADGRYVLRTYISPSETLNGAMPNDYGISVFKCLRPFPERLDAEMARRFADYGDRVAFLEDEEAEDPGDTRPPVHHLSPGFKFPPDTNTASVREMLDLTNRQLRGLTDDQLKILRFPPDWVRMGMNEELSELARERNVGKPLLPMRYFDSKTSGFRVTVKLGEEEPLVVNLELTDEE
ncbi:MAG TPA: carboxypeptidase-like regulatory domain-containing protein [Pirellulales bacterium]|nr:carboxypeptidase-like regulatory domain-containing protein [Pirellulales bacterium]